MNKFQTFVVTLARLVVALNVGSALWWAFQDDYQHATFYLVFALFLLYVSDKWESALRNADMFKQMRENGRITEIKEEQQR